MQDHPQNILITGGAGFIGSALVRFLLEKTTATLINLDALTYAGNLASFADIETHPRYRFVHGDINDAPLLADLLSKHRPSVIMHLAAESHVDRSISGAAEFIRTNVCGTYVLLDECLRFYRILTDSEKEQFRFVHVSTDEVHGSLEKEDAPFTESTRYAPRSPYSATKAASDHLVRAWHHTYGLPVIVSNCSNNYGPRQYPEKLIPLALMKMLHGENIPLYGNGTQIRDWLHVDDHCSALWEIACRGRIGESYVIGSGREMNNRALLDLLCSIMDELAPRADAACHQESIVSVTDRPGHDARYAIDATKLRSELAWQPNISLEEGLRSTVRWYLDHRAWWEPLWKNQVARGM